MITLAIKATLAMLLTLAGVALLRRARASVRHLLFASLFVFLLLLPAASIVRSQRHDIKVSAERGAARWAAVPPAAGPAAARQASGLPHIDWINAYFAVSAMLLAWLAIGVLRLTRMARRGEVWLEGTARMNELAVEAGIRRVALVILSRETAVPLTFGFRRSTILLPQIATTWSDSELRRALRHELEHIQREDWAAQLLARVACALYWAHPLVWVAWRRFCFEAERACDDAVVGTFEDAEDYAGQLVTLAKSVRFSMVPALGMASRSRLSERVHALLDRSQRRGPFGRVAAAVVMAAMLLVLVTIGPARLVAEELERKSGIRSSEVGEVMVKAAEKGDLVTLRELLDAGFDVNTVRHGDGTALIGAARGGHVDVVRFLIERGADVNLASLGDGNPLIAASERGFFGIVELLLDEGANIDTVVEGDENPIIQAAWNGHEDIVRLLINRGADVNVACYEHGEKRTALRMAKSEGHDAIANLLVAAGATH